MARLQPAMEHKILLPPKRRQRTEQRRVNLVVDCYFEDFDYFWAACLSAGYRAREEGKTKRSDTTGKDLCERFTTGQWRNGHETHAKRLFGIGWDQAEWDIQEASKRLAPKENTDDHTY